MENLTPETGRPPAPKRGIFSILVLLALVLTVTIQLVTGFMLVAGPGIVLLAIHTGIGLAALVLVIAEWIWLMATRPGRHRLQGFFGSGTGPSDWSEGAFLVAVTLTVLAGALLAAIMRLGASLPFAPLLTLHRALAVAVAVLYLPHSGFAMRRNKAGRRNGMI